MDYQICTSVETIAELENGNYPNKQSVLIFIHQISKLKYQKEIFNIAQFYVKNFLMPQDLKGDAIHLAYASYYEINYLLTWNCRHLANANKFEHIRNLNDRLNLPTPEIITPLQLFKEDNDV